MLIFERENLSMVKSKEQALEIAQSARGKRISELNSNNRDLGKNNKGVIGQIIEESLFGLAPNNRSEADFFDIGLELKVTGVKKSKKKEFVAKERLVLNVIDYEKEQNIVFEDSSFWNKNKDILLLLYLYEDNLNTFDFLIVDSILHNFNENDLEIIKKDWKYIKNKIEKGEAHLLSEADTMYLGACTKGATSESSYRKQPFSDELAKQRAYSLKSSYVTQIIQDNIHNIRHTYILSKDEVKKASFEEALNDKLVQYVGIGETVLQQRFQIKDNLKNKHERLIAAMLNIDGKISETEEFLKANIKLKTIRIEENGKIRESMSFPSFKYEDIFLEEWEESNFRTLFFNQKFAFAIFEKKEEEYFFQGIKMWNMPSEIIDTHVKKLWTDVKKIISDGNIVKSVEENGTRRTNFPGISEIPCVHVRPHGRNKHDVYPLPVPDKVTGEKEYTKYCLWLDRDYIKNILKDI